MISKEEIRHLAWLSRINLSESELDSYVPQIENIVKYFDLLDKVPLQETERPANQRSYSDMRPDEISEFSGNPFGTQYRKDGFIKGPRMT